MGYKNALKDVRFAFTKRKFVKQTVKQTHLWVTNAKGMPCNKSSKTCRNSMNNLEA